MKFVRILYFTVIIKFYLIAYKIKENIILFVCSVSRLFRLFIAVFSNHCTSRTNTHEHNKKKNFFLNLNLNLNLPLLQNNYQLI